MYNLSRLDPSYIMEVHKFIVAATRHAQRTKQKHIYCPCTDCKNVAVFGDVESIKNHLVCREFMPDYLIRTKHGEGSSAPYTADNDTAANTYVEGPMPTTLAQVVTRARFLNGREKKQKRGRQELQCCQIWFLKGALIGFAVGRPNRLRRE